MTKYDYGFFIFCVYYRNFDSLNCGNFATILGLI